MSTESALSGAGPFDNEAGFVGGAMTLNACLNSHGLYDPLHLVLRLSPEVHRKIAVLQTEIVTGTIGFEGFRAYSTYVHETIHWWQHIGSVTGLMLSLSYPGQAHANHTYLKTFLERIGPKKSLRRFVENAEGPGGDPETPVGLASIVVNNHFDFEFFRALAVKPEFAREAITTRISIASGTRTKSLTATSFLS